MNVVTPSLTVGLLPRSHDIASPRNNIQSHGARNYLDPSDFVLRR